MTSDPKTKTVVPPGIDNLVNKGSLDAVFLDIDFQNGGKITIKAKGTLKIEK